MVRWQTANEFNVSQYNIQRSYRGADAFENIGSVAADNKAYNVYSFVDDKVSGAAPWALYRIQGIDKDGQRSYSEVRRVRFGEQVIGLQVYPNPAKGIVNVAFEKMNAVIITDLTGRVVLRRELSNVHTLQIDVSHLPKGMYILKAQNANGNIETTKLIVE